MKLLPLSIFRLKQKKKSHSGSNSCCPIELSVMMEVVSVLSVMVATSPMWLLSSYFVASATQEMYFIVFRNYLNICKCQVAVDFFSTDMPALGEVF